MDIAIIVALQEEFPVKINPFPEYTFYTGIGKVNAAIAATRIVERYDPKVIINIGTAGSCLRKLQGLVECGVFIDRDIDEKLTQSKKIITDRNKAIISTGDKFITEKLDDCHLVDMESYAIAKVCHINDIKFKCYKYITDYVGSNSSEIWEENIKHSHPSFIKVIYDHFQNSV